MRSITARPWSKQTQYVFMHVGTYFLDFYENNPQKHIIENSCNPLRQFH